MSAFSFSIHFRSWRAVVCFRLVFVSYWMASSALCVNADADIVGIPQSSSGNQSLRETFFPDHVDRSCIQSGISFKSCFERVLCVRKSAVVSAGQLHSAHLCPCNTPPNPCRWWWRWLATEIDLMPHTRAALQIASASRQRLQVMSALGICWQSLNRKWRTAIPKISKRTFLCGYFALIMPVVALSRTSSSCPSATFTLSSFSVIKRQPKLCSLTIRSSFDGEALKLTSIYQSVGMLDVSKQHVLTRPFHDVEHSWNSTCPKIVIISQIIIGFCSRQSRHRWHHLRRMKTYACFIVHSILGLDSIVCRAIGAPGPF